MIRVLVVDDHPVVRHGIKQILAATGDIAVAGEAERAAEAFEKARPDAFDVVLLDISLPGLSGLDVLRRLRAEVPELPVLVLSIHAEDQYAVRSLRAGAAGYLTKASAPAELVGAIRRVAAGRKYITPTLGERLASQLDAGGARPLHEALSDREHQVLCLIASGRTPTQIAEELCLSVKTVSTYRTRILQKMGMRHNADLTRYAIQHTLVE